MSGVQNISVSADEAGMRLDRWFKTHFPTLTHGRLEKLLRTGQVRVDGGRVKGNSRLEVGNVIRIPPLGDAADMTAPKAKKTKSVSAADSKMLQDAVLYRDDDVIVINKPPGLAVQGGSKTARHLDAMLDALMFDATERPRLVHRLDRDTSGVLLLARNRRAAQVLSRAFQRKEVQKIYWALVHGVPNIREGEMQSRMLKSGGEGDEKMGASDKGQKAITLYAVQEQAGQLVSVLALRPVTGRTHQLRVHCAELGHPIVGDGKYGDPEKPLPEGVARQLHLHAREVTFQQPRTGNWITRRAPLPKHMADSWALYGFDTNSKTDAFAHV